MTHILKAIRIIAILLLFSTLWTTSGYAVTPAQIMVWVARQMNVEHVYTMPSVRYVSRTQMQLAFKNLSHQSFVQWKQAFGEVQAQSIMDNYMERVLGFFNPRDSSIYIGDYLPSCRQKAVLAHELSHYFQDMLYGSIKYGSYGYEDMRLLREMEAYNLEMKFMKLFCDTEGNAINIVALLY